MDILQTDDAPASHRAPRHRLIGSTFGPGMRCQSLMFLFCILFGMAQIAETQSAGDGGWFWYATLLHNGVRLYSQMHLALQPLFVLETEFFLKIFGLSWIASKIPAVLHLIAYCLALRLLVRRSDFTDAQKAIVFGCGFFFPLGFQAYRFDDYHVLTDCFQLFSLLAILELPKASKQLKLLLLAAVLGMLCGLSMTTRLNDGAALVVGVALSIALLAPRHRLRALALFSFAAALTVVLVVRCTGDSLHDYASYSIFHAAGSKGGAGSVLAYPLQLPINTLRWLKHQRDGDLLILYVVLCATLWVLLKRAFLQRQNNKAELAAAAGCVAVLGIAHRLIIWVLPLAPSPDAAVSLVSVSAVLVLFAYVLAAVISFRILRWLLRSFWPYSWDRRQVILLIPIGQLASGSMSSAGTHLSLYGPLGVLIVLLAIYPPFVFRTQWPRDLAIAVAAILVAATAIFRVRVPYTWHTYRERPLFTNRTVYRHPVYGPMVIDKDLLAMIQPVCTTIGSDGPQPQLLSLPYSYANYFCATPPWDGYVQTFFDTSSKETIDGLMSQLDSAPPKWIFYQRQLYTLALHETIYNHGQPLEHRYLDQMIEQKIADGAWHVVYTSSYGNSQPWDNHWLLIRTTP